MNTCVKTVLVAMMAAACTIPAAAQSFNIDIGAPASPPASTYAGVGRAGQWLPLVAAHNSTTFNIPDVNGIPTPVRVWQYGGTALLEGTEPIAGDDGALMNDCRVTYTSNLETCLFFYDLVPGTYEVIVYSSMPDQPRVMSYVSCDEEPGFPHLIVGGAWPGAHQEMVTYSRHVATVTTGLLRVHSGIVPGHNPGLGAAFNGIQIRPLPPSDINLDGSVNIDDLVAVITSWGSCPNNCAGPCPADVNHTCTVDIDDLVAVITSWGS